TAEAPRPPSPTPRPTSPARASTCSTPRSTPAWPASASITPSGATPGRRSDAPARPGGPQGLPLLMKISLLPETANSFVKVPEPVGSPSASTTYHGAPVRPVSAELALLMRMGLGVVFVAL